MINTRWCEVVIHERTYLNVFGEKIVCEYMKRSEITDAIEFEQQFYVVVWIRLLLPAHPTVS